LKKNKENITCFSDDFDAKDVSKEELTKIYEFIKYHEQKLRSKVSEELNNFLRAKTFHVSEAVKGFKSATGSDELTASFEEGMNEVLQEMLGLSFEEQQKKAFEKLATDPALQKFMSI
jgi:hypothetical protein